ncbi:MAG: helix-turn-helix domain-containing protein [Oscillospiraceae bacterium]|nr:helix-turn-helix domain-containing protein [Oscillospiraceae bacterium]
MNNRIKENTYLNICDWMMKLGLTSKELLVYALIYSYSMDGVNDFHGSFNYLVEWTQAGSKTTVARILNNLEKKKLIRKSKYKIPDRQVICSYQVTEPRGDYKLFDCITIYPWMINDLKLKDRNLILYALIYGFSKQGSDSWCTASLEYFAGWLDIPKKNCKHIRDRYLTPLKNKNLIEVNRNGYIISYRALIPGEVLNGKTPQNDNTFGDGKGDLDPQTPQNDNTSPQNDNTKHPKMTTNSLVNSLVSDKFSVNNNSSSKFTIPVYKTEEDLSVVVNEKIPADDFVLDQENEAFVHKKQHDFMLYSRFGKDNPLLPFIMYFYAIEEFRLDLAVSSSTSFPDEASELLADAVSSPLFRKRQRDILALGEEKIRELYRIAVDLCSPDGMLQISKSKKAYLIGVIKIMLGI